MTRRGFFNLLFFLVVTVPGCALGQPAPAAVLAFNHYAGAVEARLAEQHRSREHFLCGPAMEPQGKVQLQRGELVVEPLTPATAAVPPGAMLHHWRGTAFAPGARAADFERLLWDFAEWPREFSPEVVQARALREDGDHAEARMRVRERHVITVTMDVTYDIHFGRLDGEDGYSTSRSTQISEIEAPGTTGERALAPGEGHGFLWRMNTYWSYEERDGGLYIQIETISLTRSIPVGLGWVVGSFVESIPRTSLEFTLRSACNALRRSAGGEAETSNEERTR